MAWRGKNRKGKDVTLLTPSEKSAKFAAELRTGSRLTNNGEKKDKPLTVTGRSYRAGYLDARKDNAKAWKHREKKKAEKRAARKSKKK